MDAVAPSFDAEEEADESFDRAFDARALEETGDAPLDPSLDSPIQEVAIS